MRIRLHLVHDEPVHRNNKVDHEHYVAPDIAETENEATGEGKGKVLGHEAWRVQFDPEEHANANDDKNDCVKDVDCNLCIFLELGRLLIVVEVEVSWHLVAVLYDRRLVCSIVNFE